MVLPCVGKQGTSFPADVMDMFIKLSLPNMQIFVPEYQVRDIADGFNY